MYSHQLLSPALNCDLRHWYFQAKHARAREVILLAAGLVHTQVMHGKLFFN